MSIVGKRVEYSMTNKDRFRGVVLDKINMQVSQEDRFSITGYLIKNETSGEIKPIQNWRILKVIEEKMPASASEGPSLPL